MLKVVLLVLVDVVASYTTSLPYYGLECGAELTVCVNDEVCGDCWNAFHWDRDGWDECYDFVIRNSSPGCEYDSASACCGDFLSEYDCLGNSFYEDYHLCLNGCLNITWSTSPAAQAPAAAAQAAATAAVTSPVMTQIEMALSASVVRPLSSRS